MSNLIGFVKFIKEKFPNATPYEIKLMVRGNNLGGLYRARLRGQSKRIYND